jgi:hypothetical protein
MNVHGLFCGLCKHWFSLETRFQGPSIRVELVSHAEELIDNRISRIRQGLSEASALRGLLPKIKCDHLHRRHMSKRSSKERVTISSVRSLNFRFRLFNSKVGAGKL